MSLLDSLRLFSHYKCFFPHHQEEVLLLLHFLKRQARHFSPYIQRAPIMALPGFLFSIIAGHPGGRNHISPVFAPSRKALLFR